MHFLAVVMRVIAPLSMEELGTEDIFLHRLEERVVELQTTEDEVDPAYTDELPELLQKASKILARGKRLQGEETKTKAIIGVAYAKAYADSHANGVTLSSWSNLDRDLIVHFAQLIRYYRQQDKLTLLFMQLIVLASQK